MSDNLSLNIMHSIYNDHIKSNNFEMNNIQLCLCNTNEKDNCKKDNCKKDNCKKDNCKKDNYKKDNYKKDKLYIKTDDIFYKSGILENIISDKFNDINEIFNDYHFEKIQQISNTCVNKKAPKIIFDYLISYDRMDGIWLLGYYAMIHANEHNTKFTREITNNNTNVLIIGDPNNAFVSGVHCYLHYNKILSDMDWLSCSGIHNGKLRRDIYKLLKKKQIKLVGNNMFNYNNIANIKIQVENKFSITNVIFGNLNPVNNSKSLILNLIFSILILSKNGFCVTKIKSPHLWDDSYKSYMMIYSMFFYSVEIAKFPVCVNNKYFYNYFLIAHTKKKVINKNTLYKKLLNYFLCDEIQMINFDICDKYVLNDNNSDNIDILSNRITSNQDTSNQDTSNQDTLNQDTLNQTKLNKDIYKQINILQKNMINEKVDIQNLYNLIEFLI